MLSIGIDIGSKTIKACVLQDADDSVAGQGIAASKSLAPVLEACEVHSSRIFQALGRLLDMLEGRFGDVPCKLAFTGSGAMGLSAACGMTFVQEVAALRRAIAYRGFVVDAAVEMGGEDSKAVYFSEPLEQRMNTSCAGGTGSFLEDVADLLGVDMALLDKLAGSGTPRYQVASRCAVFALRDLKPLVNSDARHADIAASVYAAVVDQTLATLCLGRKLSGRVMFLGGPFEHLPNLVGYFAERLGLAANQVLKPDGAQLFCAYGAALAACDAQESTIALCRGALQAAMGSFNGGASSLDVLPQVGATSQVTIPAASLHGAAFPLYAGFDLGSSSAKLAVIDSRSRLVFSRYELSPKQPARTAECFWQELADELQACGKGIEDVASVVSCGYGEDEVTAVCSSYSVVPETSAHLRAAVELCPDASFVLDIGGQDMKAMWVKDAKLEDIAVNESCSSGCGAFIANAATALQVPLADFDALACAALSPVDLGTRCTVFMRSRIRQAQEQGATQGDIAAGAAYSVARNALLRLIGPRRMGTLGNRIVVQGGAFQSDAVLAAFEAELGRSVVRPACSQLMGAIGAALLGLDAAYAAQLTGAGQTGELAKDSQTECTLDIADCGDDGQAPNTVAFQQRLLASYKGVAGRGNRASIKVGIVNALNDYEALPFWHTCLAHLGFGVVLASDCAKPVTRSSVAQTLASDTVCLPAQLVHKRVLQVAAAGATCVLCPSSDEAGMCTVTREYQGTLPDAMRSALSIPVLVPKLGNFSPRAMGARLVCAESLRGCLENLLPEGDRLSQGELEDAVRAGQAAYNAFVARVEGAAQDALDWVHASPSRHGIVLSGRSYHTDPDLLGDIDAVLADEGFAVLAPLGVSRLARKARRPFIDHTVDRRRTWMAAKRVLGFAALAASDPQLDCVFLQSFGCGMDAVNHVDAQRMLQKNNRPFTLIKLDEKSDARHTRLRVRALADAIKNRRAAELAEEAPSRGKGTHVQANGCGGYGASKTDLAAGSHGTGAPAGDVPPAQRAQADTAQKDRALTKAPVLEVDLAPCYDTNAPSAAFDGLSDADVASAMSDYPSDLCSTACLLAAYAVRKSNENPAARIEVPLPCEGCVLESVQHFVTLAGCDNIVEWVSDWPARQEEASSLLALANGCGAFNAGVEHSAASQDTQRIGICANPLLLFDRRANQGIFDFVRSRGVKPILPDLYTWYSDVAHYLPQLENLEAKGVRSVLIVQSFLCHKGHVHTRGALKSLRERFPHISFAVVDIDLNASELNVRNRVLLALEDLVRED